MKKILKKCIYFGLIVTVVVGAIMAKVYYFRRKQQSNKGKTSDTTTIAASTKKLKVPFPDGIVQAFDAFLNTNASAYGDQLMVYVSQGNMEYLYKKGNNKFDDYAGIASCGKYLAAATIMTLVDEGKINLDTPISTYLPWMQSFEVYNTLTTREILAHRTTIVADSMFDNTQTLNLDASTRAIASQYPITTMGSAYSSTSYKFAARVAEVVSGQKWESLFQERIASKCEMKNTYFNQFSDNPDVGKGAQSSPNDYANFMEMIRNDGEYKGTRILSAVSVREMEKLQLGSSEYGLGCWVFPDVSEVAAQAATGTRAWINRNNNSYAVLFTQQDNSAMISQQFKELVGSKL